MMIKTENPAERSKFIILALVGLLYSIGVALLVQNMMARGFPVTDDFHTRYYATQKLFATGRSLYDWANSVELANIGHWPLVHQLGYYYPAYLLIFTGPLSLLPFAVARVIWTIFGLWCLWLGIVIPARELSPRLSINSLTLLLVLTTISIPVLQHTLNAQFSGLGALALVLSLRALRKKSYLLAGLWAGGLLFKPQTMIIPLLAWLIWAAWRPERRYFWLGLGLISLILWATAELMEPGWVIHFWRALANYEPVQSVMDQFWNPYQLVSLALVGITAWFAIRLRHVAAGSPAFTGLLLWALCVNGLVVPLFAMLHMVIIGLMFVLFISGYGVLYPAAGKWVWVGVLGLFVAGLAAFITPLLLFGLSGPHIRAAEVVYKITTPLLLAGAALPLMFQREVAFFLGEKVRPIISLSDG